VKKTIKEELNDLYSSYNIVRVMKSRRMSLAVHVARMVTGRYMQGIGGETTRKIWA
jgi:hypothetical protein